MDMQNMTWKTGEFCWIDTMTTDLPKSKEFYNKVFGWEYDETPTPNGPYAFSKIAKGEVGGLSELSEEMKKQNIPSFWEAYVKVEDTDAIVAKAKELGGKVMAEPFDVMEYGRMAVLASPSGAAFCLWQSKDTKEAPRTSGMEHGMYGWVELNTNNVDADGAFYCNLFGWIPKTSKMPQGETYTEFRLTEDSKMPVAGMMEIQKEWGDVPSHWNIYFTVTNIETTVKSIEDAGGKIVVPTFNVPTVGQMAVAQDSTGAHFSIAQWDFSNIDC